MTFLFGDSSPSDLRIDYIELLRDALDFSVQVLLADERMQRGVTRVDEAKRAAEAETTRLTELGATLARAVEGADVGAPDSATAQCAHELLLRSSETVRAAGERVQAQLTAEAGRIEEEARRDRERCVEALQQFLKRHDLPNMSSELRLQQQGGLGYVARLYVRGLQDLQAVLDLEIPATHSLKQIVRVEKLVERLEVHAPEAGGWLRKEVKLRPQRLDKENVTAAVIGPHDTTIHLRSSGDGSGEGYDLIYKDESPRVILRRVGEATDLPPFDLDDTDSAKVRELRTNLVALTNELTRSRKSLVEAALAGTPLYDYKEARVLVERLVSEMAPTVREIARRSLTKTELVLKRQTGDGRREEIFVSRVDLQEKLRPLGQAARAVFKPLELGEPPPNDLTTTPVPAATGKSEAKSPAEPKIASSASPPKPAAPAPSPSRSRSSLFGEALEASAGDARPDTRGEPKPASMSREITVDGRLDAPRVGPPPRNTQEEPIAIDDSLDRLLVSDAAPKSK
jgi:hypothetical protein